MIRPLNDWLLVKLDPIPQSSGSIVLLHGTRVRTATVEKVGPGRWSKSGHRIPTGVEPGEKIAFYRENLEHKQGKQLLGALAELGEDLGLLRANDVLFAYVGEGTFE